MFIHLTEQRRNVNIFNEKPLISVTRLGSGWHVASTEIVAPYKAFSREKLPARIGAHIGLMHINITLNGKLHFFLNYNFTPLGSSS